MGSAGTSVNVVFDTASIGLAVMGSTCTTNCAATVYDETGSSDYVNNNAVYTNTFANNKNPPYWYQVTGNSATDRVAIDADTSTYNLFLITGMSDTQGSTFTPVETGWLGLAYNRAPGYSDSYDFLEQVVAKGFLTGNKQFSLNL